jgi:phage terminase large subunit-like protein
VTPKGQAYIDGVLSGDIVTGLFIKQAVNRYVSDLQKTDWPYKYDASKASRAITFIECFKHSKSDFADLPFVLEPWQHFLICNLFGWIKKSNGKRRYTKCYLSVARKNGKTQIAAAIAIYMLIADGESGAEIYSVATKRDQAKIVWDAAREMIIKQHDLDNLCHVWRGTNTITFDLSLSKFLPLSAESKTHDGLNPYLAIIDEYHAHKTNELLEIMSTGMGARSQSLLLITTTAGYDISSPCYEEDIYCQNILNGTMTNDQYFSLIYRPDEGDDWMSDEAILKSNPNFGITVQKDYLHNKFNEAKNSARMTNDVKVKHLNLWCQVVTRWMTDESWMICKRDFKEADLYGRHAILGMDLSASQDITALVLDILPLSADEPHYLVTRFFLPEDNLIDHERVDNFPYEDMVDKNLLIPTPGDVIDYDFIESEIHELAKSFIIDECAFDPWKAQEIVNHLTEERIFTMTPIFMRYSAMAAPTDQFEKDILAGKIAHDGNPILRWMLGNTEVKSDRQGNIMPMKPRRETTGKRIDGIVAAIMAHGRATIIKKPLEPSIRFL